jgi:hypothetical protein
VLRSVVTEFPRNDKIYGPLREVRRERQEQQMKRARSMAYIMVDVEADGPIPRRLLDGLPRGHRC